MKKILTLLFVVLSMISGWSSEEKREFKTALEEFFGKGETFNSSRSQK